VFDVGSSDGHSDGSIESRHDHDPLAVGGARLPRLLDVGQRDLAVAHLESLGHGEVEEAGQLGGDGGLGEGAGAAAGEGIGLVQGRRAGLSWAKVP
jgi:hypothetical protein